MIAASHPFGSCLRAALVIYHSKYYEKIGKDICEITDIIPFEIPNNWCWARASSIAQISMGQSPDGESINTNKGVEFHQGKIHFTEKYLALASCYTSQPSKFAEPLSLLLCVRAPVGVANITERRICIGRGLCSLNFYKGINLDLMFYFFTSFKSYYEDLATGSTFKAISKDIVADTLVPIPPENEQIRIVELIKAMYAKLSQPHSKYYEKVGPKVLGINEEIPFDIPKGWVWSRLDSLFAHNTGKALNRADQDGRLFSYITTSNLYWNRFELDDLRKMHFNDSELEKCTVIKGDLLVCEGGDIGRSAIWPYDEEIRIQNHIHRLRPYIPVNVQFYYYYMLYLKLAGMIGGKGIGIQGLSSKALGNIFLPVPPLAEQEKITQKIQELFAAIR